MNVPGGTVITPAPETWEEGQGLLLAYPRGRRTGLASIGAVLNQEKAMAVVVPGVG